MFDKKDLIERYPEGMLTVKQVSELTGKSTGTVNNWIVKGKLIATRTRKKYEIAIDDRFVEFVNSRVCVDNSRLESTEEMSMEEVAEYFEVEIACVEKLALKWLIPHNFDGKKITFSRKAIEAWKRDLLAAAFKDLLRFAENQSKTSN
ncbi:MAG: helix-turn-helix domain-containing protein [Candidatus Paceibacterota bacterium]